MATAATAAATAAAAAASTDAAACLQQQQQHHDINRQQMTLQWTVHASADDSGLGAEGDASQSSLSGPLPQPAEYCEDEACSLVDSTTWHENDLILAAELGKALLERNRDLEQQLASMRVLCEHQAQEIELLGRQVQTLRGLNDGKARMVEEVDRQCAELEAQQRVLVAERATAKERASALAKQVVGLEGKVEELTGQLERALAAASRRNCFGDAKELIATGVTLGMNRPRHSDDGEDDKFDDRHHQSASAAAKASKLKKTLSFSDLGCGGGGCGSCGGVAVSDVQLLSRVSSLTCQVARLTARNEELKADLALQTVECEKAKQEVAKLTTSQRRRLQMTVASNTLTAATNAVSVGTLAHISSTPSARPSARLPYQPLKDADEFEEFLGAASDDLTSLIESDVQQIRGDADCGQLESGGTVFSSEENLCRIGATKKLADTALAEISLLSELNDQYNRLVVEYEHLLAGKKSRVQASQTPDGVQQQQQQQHLQPQQDGRVVFEQKLTGIFAEETRSERKRLVNQDYRPKYKDLFRDAMSRLRDMKCDSKNAA